METLGNIIVIAGIIFMFFGIVGIFKFDNFYTRILVTAKIDTVGVLTLMIGLIVKHGVSFFSLKVLLLMVLMMIINPLASHMIARAAYLSGYKTETQIEKDNEDNKDYL